MADHWEVAELVARLDPGVATRLLAAHPGTGRCRTCGSSAPCAARRLAEATEVVTREMRDSPS